MKIWHPPFKFIEKSSLQYKLALLIYPTWIEKAMIRSHERARTRLRERLVEGKQCDALDFDTNQMNDIFLHPISNSMRNLRGFLACMLNVLTIKYLLVFLVLDKQILPLHLNCYLPGRSSLHSSIIDHMHLLSFVVSLYCAYWYHTMTKSRYHIDLDLVSFLLCDARVINNEIERVEEQNRSRKYRCNHIFPENMLQRVLFYRVNYGDSEIHRLRPNRLSKHREDIVMLLDILMIYFFASITSSAIMTALISAPVRLFDTNYIRNYPTCCGALEQLLERKMISSWSMSYNICVHKLFMMLADWTDIAILFIGAGCPIMFGGILSVIITEDLLHYWRCIRFSLKELLNKYEQHTHLDSVARDTKKNHETERIYRVRREISKLRDPHLCDCKIIELQAMIADFFECMGRADSFVNVVASFVVVLFIGTHLTFGYLAIVRLQLWSLMPIRILFCTMYSLLIVCAAFLLRLRRETNVTFPDLCALMAHDRSNRKLNWIRIMENFTFRKRNCFTIFSSIPFTPYLVLNLVSTGATFLFVIETYKVYRLD